MPRVWFHCFISLLTINIATCQTAGICNKAYTNTRHRWVVNQKKNVWQLQTYDEVMEHKECCEGYQLENPNPLECLPVCKPECMNSTCMEPNVCICYPGHQKVNNSTTTCHNICDSCINGACPDEGELAECKCHPGYEKDQIATNMCNPTCSPSCINATCTAPSECTCFQGFSKHVFGQPNVCVPECSSGCIFGKCTDPGVCSCFEGYMNDASSPDSCIPVCNHTCENGECGAPNSCKCQEGFELHPRDPFLCVPIAPTNLSLSFCEFQIMKAVKYDANKNCFIIKDNITISNSVQCQSLKEISQPICFHPQNCNHNQCSLTFQCSAKKVNGSNEIHCNLETNDFETESVVNNVIMDKDWSDVTLILNSYQHSNFSFEDVHNETRVWSLRPSSKLPVCGKMHFAVEINSCGSLSPSWHINKSAMTWINVILISAFVILTGAGVGGYLWMRHRVLNNPLNYRENVVRGYNNESYENRPAELASDDEDEDDHDTYIVF